MLADGFNKSMFHRLTTSQVSVVLFVNVYKLALKINSSVGENEQDVNKTWL